jgi:DNA-binding LacI/PurR family transcriptional regulator
MPERTRKPPATSNAPTLRDVARAAQVSTMTASRALNGLPRVSNETRERVLRAAADINYRPSLSARALRSNQSRLIGLVAYDLNMPAHIEIILGARDRAADYDHDLLIQPDRARLSQGLPQNCDGYLVIGGLPDDHPFDPKRTVNLLGAPSQRLDVCRTDSSQAVHAGFTHLLGAGYRRIGLILVAPTTTNAGRDTALQEYGLPATDELTRAFDPANTGLVEAVGEFLALDPPLDALMVHNVAGTPVVLRELQRRGVHIGKDLGFIGTEASLSDWGDLITPRMTTIRVPGYSIGAAGAARLIERLRGDESPPRLIEFPAELIVRDSTPSV